MLNKKSHLVAPVIYSFSLVYTRFMDKHVILFFAIIFELVGNFIPVLFGNNDFLGGWSILGGLIGGLIGVWIGIVVSRKFF